MSKLLNNAALISSHVISLTSRASFFIEPLMFSIGFRSSDCGGHSILRLSLFSNHADTAMALWEHCLTRTQRGVAGP